MTNGKIIFFSGKMGIGKTTYSKELSKKQNTVLLSEDIYLKHLFPNEINSLKDYITYSKRIKPLIKDIVKQLTDNSITVIMDFPGNTIKQRNWFRELIEFCNTNHKLIYLKGSDELCIKQISKRREEDPNRHQFDNETVFYEVTKYFQEPSESEGFNLEVIKK